MALSKIIISALAGTIAVGGVAVASNTFNSENLEAVKANYTKVEQTLKENEGKLVDKYNQLHSDATAEIARIEEEKTEVENKKAELEKYVAELEEQIKDLENSTIGDMKKEIAELKASLVDAESEIDWLDSELVKYDEMLEQKHEQLIEANEMIEELKEQIANGGENESELQKALDAANKEIERANTEVQSLMDHSAERAASIGSEITDVDGLPTIGN